MRIIPKSEILAKCFAATGEEYGETLAKFSPIFVLYLVGKWLQEILRKFPQCTKPLLRLWESGALIVEAGVGKVYHKKGSRGWGL